MPTAHFLGPLDIRKIGPTRWLVLDDLQFFSARYRGAFVVPRGFQTDLASIPPYAQSLISKVGPYDRAAVLHDAAYGHALETVGGVRVHAVKVVADSLFHEGMRADGVNRVQAWLMWRMVSAFGNPHAHPLAENRTTASFIGFKE